MGNVKYFLLFILFLITTAPAAWNNPHTHATDQSILFSAFTETPKTLDPARAYSAEEDQIISQVYEPPLQYDYFARPYKLIPNTLTAMPTVTYLNKDKKPLPASTDYRHIAYTIYTFHIKPGIYFQPSPIFSGPRELTARDYVYQIKRLADPMVHSPIYGLMEKYIVGFGAFSKKLEQVEQAQLNQGIKHPKIDLNHYSISGVTVINPYQYQITIHGYYPQFIYWMAMHFFAPMPHEAIEKNIPLDTQLIGTGPYMLIKNNPSQEMILKRNPNFTHGTIPKVEQVVLTLDKESIPRWHKFLQGYYDRSGIGSDSYEQAIELDQVGDAALTQDMKEKNLQLEKAVAPSIFYMGFNMRDPIVGGHSEKNKKLRQAISIAIDYEEFVQLFLNGRGVVAEGPIPPGIFGYENDHAHFNHVIYFWDGKALKRKPLSVAKELMREAGYPNGMDPKTHHPLVLNYDVASTNNPDDRSQLNWMRKQFLKLGIHLNIRQTDYNRFQDKMNSGQAQIFSYGWLADYPDPENFLFQLYGPNGKVKFSGENSANYENPQYDTLFLQMKNMPDSPARLAKIRELVAIVQNDSPWIWGVHPISYTLSHAWVTPVPPNPFAFNGLKYQKINPALRKASQENWNQPVLWPLWVLLGLLIAIFIPLMVTYFLRENKPTVRKRTTERLRS